MELQKSFLEQLQQLLPDEWQALYNTIVGTEPSVSVRVNVRRGATLPSGASRVPWCESGFYLDDRPSFTFDPAFHSGLYYVQDASSMFLHHVLKNLVTKPVRYLDLCAAPGGKTTTALGALPAGSLVVANEIVTSRARVLRDNVIKWGNPFTIVTNNASYDLGQLTHFFDIIATDVPCSGEGMMRKDDEAVAQWSRTLVEECAARQQFIIDDVWNALRPGGLLIYSTCTYNRLENEQMIEYIISKYDATPVSVPIEPEWNIMGAIGNDFPAYRFMPHRTRGEGLFMAILRKGDGEDKSTKLMKRKGKSTKSSPLPATVSKWLKNPQDYFFISENDEIIATPHAWHREIDLLREHLNTIYHGIALGTMKGKNCVPAHALALSESLNGDEFSTCEVDYPTALAFLRGEAITIDAPRGSVLITHHGARLGWVNNLGNRANNLYPKSLRILSTHAPLTELQVL
ncbi:MAG: rRNA cytosine-C5-methyltransferase [Muribaculaceae bacterium]|nr:rRNA cytosine-C5-methyltransferase [Muribaculaceae bacterium]